MGNDVLCGRGGLTNSHVGNKLFRKVCNEFLHDYLNARKKDKKIIASRIVEHIADKGGRFLKKEKHTSPDGSSIDVWSEVPKAKALEKTLQALREGLNVREKTFRPEKLFSFSLDITADPRKRPRIVEGIVLDDSLKLNGTKNIGTIEGEENKIPTDSSQLNLSQISVTSPGLLKKYRVVSPISS